MKPAAKPMPDQGDSTPVLSLSLLGMDFGGTPILGGIDLEVSRGETVAITGPSGIGKSTLLRIVAGLEPRFKGTVHAPDRIGFVFQEPTLLRWRTVGDNLRLTCRLSRDGVEQVLSEVGLGGMADRFPDSLSLGQQRRLALARAFASGPDLLLMDEPFVSLDPALADEMMALFAALRAQRQVATLIVTHVEREADLLASRVVTMGGRPATITGERQNKGAYFQLSASGVTSSRS